MPVIAPCLDRASTEENGELLSTSVETEMRDGNPFSDFLVNTLLPCLHSRLSRVLLLDEYVLCGDNETLITTKLICNSIFYFPY